MSGASGYIGQKLQDHLTKKGHDCVPIRRELLYQGDRELSDLLAGCHAVINLAGAPIMQRWTDHNKQVIYSSRIDTTLNLAAAIRQLPQSQQPRIFVSASAVGIYSDGATHTEASNDFGDHFAAMVSKHWEKASDTLPPDTRRVIFRIGVVLGRHSQTMAKLLPLFKLGLGGKIGSGRQAFPYIHIDDLVSAFVQAIEDERLSGIYNLVEPQPITNKQFTKAMSKRLKRPALFTVPPFALKALFGQAARMILDGPTVIPQRLQEAGFQFQHPSIEQTIDEIAGH